MVSNTQLRHYGISNKSTLMGHDMVAKLKCQEEARSTEVKLKYLCFTYHLTSSFVNRCCIRSILDLDSAISAIQRTIEVTIYGRKRAVGPTCVLGLVCFRSK